MGHRSSTILALPPKEAGLIETFCRKLIRHGRSQETIEETA